MYRLKVLQDLCEGEIVLSVNRHIQARLSVDEYLNSTALLRKAQTSIKPEVLAEMRTKNAVLELHYYPHLNDEPHSCFHHDLEALLHSALLSEMLIHKYWKHGVR